MPTEVISYYLKNEDRLVRLGFQVALQCAPVLKGIKISCLISMDARLCPGLPEILMGTDLKYHCLSCSQGKCLVLFYRPDELEQYLKRADVSQLAQEYGYKKEPAEKMLERLSQRVKDFSEKGMGFPHEIVMFLGYPVADIRGFIENEGRKYLMIGYWKVYSNLSQARMIFKEYDRAKECAVQEYLTGKSIREISMKKKDGGR